MSENLAARSGGRRLRKVGRPRVWWEGLRIGLHTIRSAPVLGLKRLILPVSYWRIAEFAYVWSHLDVTPGARILDVGSPKELAFMLARNHEINVVATDILPSSVRLSKQYTDAQGLSGSATGRVHSQVQDGRRLGFADDTFDAAISVSVLEHIPDEGDRQTMRELVRVVKPGGRIVVTVPYARSYREDWVDGPVYERIQDDDNLVFFQRHYDERALRERLLDFSGIEVLDVDHWGERRIPVERWLDSYSWARRLISPLEPLLSLAALRRQEEAEDSQAMAAFFTIQISRGEAPRLHASHNLSQD